MGVNLSKRIEKTLSTSQEFTESCTQTYTHSLSQAQHAFPGLRPYQLLDASTHLHSTLTRTRLPILTRWAPPPPTRAHVDSALRRTGFRGEEFLGEPEFERFAVELFRGLIVGEIVGKVVMKGAPIGAAGIAGVAMAVGGGAQVVGRVIGVYAVGVAAAVYLSLS